MLKNYVENFQTGEVVTLEKLKPKLVLVKGSAKVELFNDHTGRKLLEAETENVINNVLAKDAFLSTFDGSIGWNSLNSVRKSYFQNIALTNHAQPESADSFYVAGDIVGWAAKQGSYVGDDTKRGTINIAESTRDYGEYKFVFDWPTHAANGTFRTLWWGGVSGSSPFASLINLNSYGYSTQLPSYRSCIGPKYWIYVAQGTGVILVRKMAFNDMSYPDYYNYALTSDTMDLSYIDTMIKGIWWDGTYFWIYGDTNKKYYKCDENFTVLLQFDAPPAAYYLSTKYNYTTLNGKFFTYTYEASNNWSFRRYDYNGVLETELNLYGQEGITAPSTMYIVGDTKCLVFHESSLAKIALVDANGNTLSFTLTNPSSNSSFSGHLLYDRKHNLFWTKWSNASSYNLYCMQPMWYPGAQTLLATPVTKTSTNTMKVTYTFKVNLPTY